MRFHVISNFMADGRDFETVRKESGFMQLGPGHEIFAS